MLGSVSLCVLRSLIGSSKPRVIWFIADKVGGRFFNFNWCWINRWLYLLLEWVWFHQQVLISSNVFSCIRFIFFTGVGNAGTFRQYPIIFAENQRQAAGVLGWTGAIAAYGPFIFATLIGGAIASSGNAKSFFIGLAVFALIGTIINWYYYQRKGCERPS